MIFIATLLIDNQNVQQQDDFTLFLAQAVYNLRNYLVIFQLLFESSSTTTSRIIINWYL